MTIGEKIKKARILKGLTQKELGNMVGLPDDRIGHYEIGRRTPKESILREIANSLGFAPDFFTDHSIDTYIDVMHILFELKNTYGLMIRKLTNDNGEQIFDNGKPLYHLSFDDKGVSDRINVWLDSIDNITNQPRDSLKSTLTEIEKDCLLWEGRYPLSHADDTNIKIKEHKKSTDESKK